MQNRFDQAAGTLARLYNAAEEGELYDDWVQAEEREEDLVEVAEEIEDLVGSGLGLGLGLGMSLGLGLWFTETILVLRI